MKSQQCEFWQVLWVVADNFSWLFVQVLNRISLESIEEELNKLQNLHQFRNWLVFSLQLLNRLFHNFLEIDFNNLSTFSLLTIFHSSVICFSFTGFVWLNKVIYDLILAYLLLFIVQNFKAWQLNIITSFKVKIFEIKGWILLK